jgi:radical SAM-linked protein
MSASAVQRWRVSYRRDGAAARLAQREATAALEAAVVASGMPLAVGETAKGRPRLMFGPPVSAGIVATEELIDVFLTERLERRIVRERLEGALPAGHLILDLHDVWVGGPSLAASVVGADYRVMLGTRADVGPLGAAIEDLLGAERIERQRDRGGIVATYDLRPFVEHLRLIHAAEGVVLEMRLGIDQQRGIGRPEGVLADLRERSGLVLDPIGPIVRGRLHLSPA